MLAGGRISRAEGNEKSTRLPGARYAVTESADFRREIDGADLEGCGVNEIVKPGRIGIGKTVTAASGLHLIHYSAALSARRGIAHPATWSRLIRVKVDELLEDCAFKRIIAQSDVTYSNSMIEAPLPA